MTQTEMFAKTELDEATAVLAHLIEERKKAGKSVSSAEEKYAEACERVVQQQHVVDLLQAQQPAAEPDPAMDGEAEECEDAEIVDESRQIEGDTVDLETGEVTSKGERSVVVVAVYPSGDPVATTIGPNTQYAELIADWLAAGGEGTIEDWRVVAELELSDPDCEYGRREPHEVIISEDYGQRLLIVSAEQGSAAGESAAA